jgi:rhodanese-related sulfurtransferase
MEIPRIEADDVAEAIRRGEQVAFVDVRSPKAYESATEQIPGSLRSTADAVASRADALPTDALTVAYCT